MCNPAVSRCLVTGAAGPLGSVITRILLSRGHRVAAMVRGGGSLQRLAGIDGKIELIEGSLEEPESAFATIKRFAPEAVFHLAWQGSGRDMRDHQSQIDVNVIGSLKLLTTVLQAGAQCWIGLGSQAEYGPFNGLLREDLVPAPANMYGLAKLCVGELSMARCKVVGVRAVWLRLFATYGPADAEDRLIPYLIRTLLDGKNPRLSAGKQRWDYLYVEDAAEAVIAAAFSECSGVFNLASGSAWTVFKLATFLKDEINPAATLELGLESPVSLEADVSKLVRAVGWSPNTDLKDGLRRTIEWYRAERRERAESNASATEYVRH